MTLSAGRDDQNGTAEAVDGFAASYTIDSWYLAGKYEDGNGNNDVWNALVQYSIDEKNTIRGMIAEYDGYGGDIYHLGFDHQYNDDFKVFAEYYSEETQAAIETTNRPEDYNGTANGGEVFTVGVRYDFSTK